jgi:transcriptional regulator with XRE-family HTH domain
MREVRDGRRMTRAQLAEQLAKIGHRIDATTIEKIETGVKKGILLDDVLAIALALQVPPLVLLLPVADTPTESNERVQIGENVQPVGMVTMREWLRGNDPLPGEDRRVFFRELRRTLARPEEDKLREKALAHKHGRRTGPGVLEFREDLIAEGKAEPLDPDAFKHPVPPEMPDDFVLNYLKIDAEEFEAVVARQAADEGKSIEEVRARGMGGARHLLLLKLMSEPEDEDEDEEA